MSNMLRQLRIAMQLDSAGFERGAKRAAAEVDALGSRAEKAGFAVGRAGKAIVAAGVAVAGSALAAQIKNVVVETLDYAKALQKQASIANASIEQFQKQAYAAQSVGIEAEKLSDIFKDVNDRVGEFLQTGGGQMKDFFEKIAPKVGVTAEQFRNLSGPDALQLYYTSLEKAGLNQQEMTFFMEAMGDEATALIPLLRNNGAEMRRMGDDAKRLGIVMSDDMVNGMVAAGKEVDALGRVMKGQLMVAVSENRDVILDLVRGLADLIGKLGEAGRAWRLWKLEVSARLYENQAEGFLTSAEDKVRAAENARRLRAQIAKESGTFLPGGFADYSTADRTKRASAAPASPIRIPSGLGGGTMLRLPKSGGGSFAPGRGPLANLSGSSAFRSSLDDLTAGGPGSMNAGAALAAIGATTEQAAQALNRYIGLTKEAEDETEVATVAIARSFGDMANDTIYALDRVAGAVRGGGFLSILSSLVGLSVQLGGAGLFGSKIAANINAPRIPARAMGGPVTAGRLHLVGERGPELFVPGASGSIVPNHALGGGGNVYHISGNLLTPEFWAMIRAGDLAAADAGGQIGAARARAAGNWRLR